MIHFEFPGPLVESFRRKECRLFVLCLTLSFVLYYSQQTADIQTTNIHDVADKNDEVIVNKMSIKERMLEHVNFTDVMQIFTIKEGRKKIVKDNILIIKQQPKYQGTIRNRRKIHVREASNNQVANFGMYMIIVYFVISAIMDTIHNCRYRGEKYDEHGNKIDGPVRKYSLADYASMRHERKSSDYLPSRNKRVYSGGLKRPLVKYDSLGMNPEYRRDYYGLNASQIYPGLRRDSYYGANVPTTYSEIRRDSLVLNTVQNYSGDIRRDSIGYGTGCETPGSPLSSRASTFKLLGARPPPLIRRSSFPAGPINNPYGIIRQGSGDSGDSSPETSRRRVRMIRRH